MAFSSTRVFRYNYAERKPEEFARVVAGSRVPVLVTLDGQLLGSSAVPRSGEIVFEIPTDLWFRHESGQVIFNVYTQQTEPDGHGRDLQIISLAFESL